MNQHHILYLCGLLMDMAVVGVTFAISRHAAELGATSVQLGLLGAMWIGVYAACALITGRVSDRVGRRRMALIGCAIATVTTLSCSTTTNVTLLLVFSGLFGAGLSCFWPSVVAWLGEGLNGAALARRLTNYNVAWNIGLLLGFAYTGVLFKHGPRLSFYVSAGAIVLIAGLLLLPAHTNTETSPSTLDPSPSAIPKGRGFRKTAWMANFAANFAFNGAAALFPQLATVLGIGADVHSWLFAVSRGAALACFVALELLMFWRTRLWPLWIAQALGAAGILAMAWGSTTAMFALSLIITGAVSGYAYQASIYFTLEEIEEKGKGSGFHEAVVGSGMFFGPIFAGWVGENHSLRAPYFFCAAALLLFVLIQMMFVVWRRERG